MTFGLTDTGLIIKRLADIDAEIDEALKSTFGPAINTLPQSIFGQLKAIFAEREALIWELVEAIYNSQYPDSAEGTSFDNVAAITALTRLPALKSSIVGQALFGTISTSIPVGTVFSVSGDSSARFVTTSTVILGAGTDEVQTITFSGTPTSGAFKLQFDGETTASINWDDAAGDIQTALNALAGLSAVTASGSFAAGFVVTFAGVDGKQPQVSMASTDNTLDDGGAVTITITETTPGIFQATVDCEAETTGPIVANAETLTVIETPVSGLDSTFNPEDEVTGRDIESDAEFRIRRNNRLQISLAGPLEAIRKRILELNEVEGSIQLEDVTIFENIDLTTDSRGIPGKAFEAVIYQAGGVTTRDQGIAQAIFDSKPAGIKPHGDVSKTVTDSQGFDHTIQFSRPTEVDIWLELDLTVDALYPSDGDTQVEGIMTDWGNALGAGVDVVVYPSLIAQLDSIPGITDVVVRIGTAVSPTLDNNIDIDDGSVTQVEISRWDTSRITVTS